MGFFHGAGDALWFQLKSSHSKFDGPGHHYRDKLGLNLCTPFERKKAFGSRSGI